MGLNSKDVLILIIGLILPLPITLLFNYKIKLDQISTIYGLIIVLALITVTATWILYMRLREAERDISNQDVEIKRLNEKLKIYEQLIDIKADIKELQRTKLKNENRR